MQTVKSRQLDYVTSFGLVAHEFTNPNDWYWYSLNNVHMWYVGIGWQVADLLDGRYTNHAYLPNKLPNTYKFSKHLTLDEAIQEVLRRQGKY